MRGLLVRGENCPRLEGVGGAGSDARQRWYTIASGAAGNALGHRVAKSSRDAGKAPVAGGFMRPQPLQRRGSAAQRSFAQTAACSVAAASCGVLQRRAAEGSRRGQHAGATGAGPAGGAELRGGQTDADDLGAAGTSRIGEVAAEELRSTRAELLPVAPPPRCSRDY